MSFCLNVNLPKRQFYESSTCQNVNCPICQPKIYSSHIFSFSFVHLSPLHALFICWISPYILHPFAYHYSPYFASFLFVPLALSGTTIVKTVIFINLSFSITHCWIGPREPTRQKPTCSPSSRRRSPGGVRRLPLRSARRNSSEDCLSRCLRRVVLPRLCGPS